MKTSSPMPVLVTRTGNVPRSTTTVGHSNRLESQLKKQIYIKILFFINFAYTLTKLNSFFRPEFMNLLYRTLLLLLNAVFAPVALGNVKAGRLFRNSTLFTCEFSVTINVLCLKNYRNRLTPLNNRLPSPS